MKKIFTILLIFILLIFTSSCEPSRRVIGDKYVVTSVKILNHQTYKTQYYIEATPVNKNANAFTPNGNKMTYYTNTFYSVGDTIKLYNSRIIAIIRQNNMITEDYISFEVAKLLKEKGFPEGYQHTNYFIDENGNQATCTICEAIGKNITTIPRPTLQMAMKWLREEKNIDIDIHTDCGMLGHKRYTPCIQTYKPKPKPELLSDEDEWNDRWIQKTIYLRYENDKGLIPACKDFSSYEEACEAAISYCLKNLI